MRFERRTIARVVLLLCVALLVTRVAGNHLHFCFDGSEPPVSLHTLEVDAHHSDEGAEHNDQDVSLPSATLAKIAAFLLDAALIAALFLFVIQLLTPRRVRAERVQGWDERPVLYFLRPPLRGPPALLPR